MAQIVSGGGAMTPASRVRTKAFALGGKTNSGIERAVSVPEFGYPILAQFQKGNLPREHIDDAMILGERMLAVENRPDDLPSGTVDSSSGYKGARLLMSRMAFEHAVGGKFGQSQFQAVGAAIGMMWRQKGRLISRQMRAEETEGEENEAFQ